MKQYEGLFILDTDTSGATVDDIIKAIGELIKEAGGNVTNEQKLDRRSFARVADKKHSGGFYVSSTSSWKPERWRDSRPPFANARMCSVLKSPCPLQ